MRVARIVLIVVVILGGLFVAADRIALSVAQNKAAEQAQTSEGLTEKPKVSIKGFPFLTQAAGGTLDHVTVNAAGVSATSNGQTVEVNDFHADLYDVKLSNGYSSAKASRATATAELSYAELTKAAPQGITVSSPGDGSTDTVKLTGSVMGTHLSVLSKISVVPAGSGDATQNSIRLHAEGLPKAFTALGLEDQVRRETDFTPELTHLPAGLGLTKVTSGSDGITIDFGGQGVVLAG